MVNAVKRVWTLCFMLALPGGIDQNDSINLAAKTLSPN